MRTFDNVVNDVLAGVHPLTAIETHDPFLRPRRTDGSARQALHSGLVTISRNDYSFSSGQLYQTLSKAGRSALLEYHSLRFIDPLRRDRSSVADEDLWLEFVKGWYGASSERDGISDAYLPASQRGVILALGLRDLLPEGSESFEFVRAILESQVRLYMDKLRSGRVHLVEETLLRGTAVITMTADSRNSIDAFISIFEDVYLADGMAPGGTIASTSDLTRRWSQLAVLLRKLYGNGVSDDSTNSSTESRISQLWVHATRPDGSLVPSGSADYQRSWHDVTPKSDAERYAATASNSGEATDELLFTSQSGWAFARSGWGETERDFDQETHLSIRYGHLESTGRHEDCSALTFSAMGVNWLDDNPGHKEDLGIDSWQGRRHHSCVAIEGRYRTHAEAELTRKRVTENCFDLEIRDNSYLPVALTRRLTYSRSGDYLVVIDQSRSADSHSGTQNWIVPPECAVKITPTGVVLESRGRACELVWLNLPMPVVSVERIEEWTRLSVTVAGASTRTITAVIPKKMGERVECKRVPLEDGAVGIAVTRPNHDEQIVITKEGAGVGSTKAETGELVERVRNEALTGGLSREEELRLRAKVRTVITRIKNDLWEQRSTLPRRKKALRELCDLAEEFRVYGLRDYGLGSNMIDIAADDLTSQIDHHPLVTGKKRSPIISWSNNTPLVHNFYQVPIRSFRSLSDDIDPKLVRQMLTFDLGQMTLPILLSQASVGKTLNVMFHGSTDRSRNAIPRFERLRSMEALGTGPAVFVSDPCLDLDASQILTWYMGSEELNLHEFIANEIDLLAQRLGCDRVLYIGNSGGGFAALQVASYSEISGVVTFNPQIRIDDYVPRISTTSQEVVFGDSSVSDNLLLKPRTDVIQRYSDINFDKRVYFIQNTGDEMHFENHFRPFASAYENSGHGEDLKCITPYLGPGHRVPPPAEYIDYVLSGGEFVFASK